MSAHQRQSRFEQSDDLVVMKFGGTSVEDAPAIRRLIGIVESRMNARPVVVVSALARVTDQLVEAGGAAASGHLGSALATVRNIYVRHEALADELVGPETYSQVDHEIRVLFQKLEALLLELSATRQLTPQLQDELLSFGECLSSHLVQAALCEAGIKAQHVDARACIVTDENHGQASPLWQETNQRTHDAVVPVLEAGMVPVLGGFIASTGAGIASTLGRGGSDFSAAILGAALGASRVEIWTDVDGIMTTDPKLCPDARVIRKMSFDEAAELAHFGAKVLHPATLVPAMRENIPVYVLNSRHPEGAGTEIVAHARPAATVSAITAKRKVAAVELELSQPIDSSLLTAVFSAFSKHSCSVDLMASSLGRISLLVSSTGALPAIAEDLKDIAKLRWENHKALICLVGENLRRQPEVASLVFGAVSDIDIRVMCQSASDRTISFLVDESRAEESVRRLHELFFPRAERARDWGGISSAFCHAG